MADFLHIPLADGGEWVSLSRLADGRVACCVCFEFCHRSELEPVVDEPGRVWDVCRTCAATENRGSEIDGEPQTRPPPTRDTRRAP
jgi:hypothetical protein